MRPQEHAKLTAGQYLALERAAESKSEYLNGELFAMAGASREHNQISSNIVASLSAQTADQPCSVYASDMKVKIDKANKYTYPDVVAVCDPQQFEDEHKDVLLNPRLIVEILSDSTEAYDRGLKFFHYQRLDSLREYLLVSQKFCHVEKYEQQADNLWAYSAFYDLDDTIAINTLHCALRLRDIYRKLELKERII
jgi:Uma2 family endonuclease